MSKLHVFYRKEQSVHSPKIEILNGSIEPHYDGIERHNALVNTIMDNHHLFHLQEPSKEISKEQLLACHKPDYLLALEHSKNIGQPQKIPYCFFPGAAQENADPANLMHLGAYSFDTVTPLDGHTYPAALASSSNAIELADALYAKALPVGYAMCRPLGHHAMKSYFGGYSYLNNAALCARRLQRLSSLKVAVLDIDFHHGNGTQDIFYDDPNVLFASLHGEPAESFPYFSGSKDQTGHKDGLGTTLNVPLEKGTDSESYLDRLLNQVLPRIRAFEASFLVVSVGFDTYKKDPLGHFALEKEVYPRIARSLMDLGLPCALIQEGGYFLPDLPLLMLEFLTPWRNHHVIS